MPVTSVAEINSLQKTFALSFVDVLNVRDWCGIKRTRSGIVDKEVVKC
jgi:hypothetical protein